MIVPDFNFKCDYCGKEFGKEPMKVAVHIARDHIDKGDFSN